MNRYTRPELKARKKAEQRSQSISRLLWLSLALIIWIGVLAAILYQL